MLTEQEISLEIDMPDEAVMSKMAQVVLQRSGARDIL